MIPPSPLPVILALVFGIVYFFVDEFHEYFPLHNSFIAGSSLAYFFLVVLPEISEGIPEYPLHLATFEFFFVLLGFITVHISEKVILQKVERIAKKKARNLLAKRKVLQTVENSISININQELETNHETMCDDDALRELARTNMHLQQQENQLQEEILVLEKKIHDHLNQEIDQLRWISGFIYHIFIGFIIYGLLESKLYLDGVFFFIFALLMALVSIRYHRELVIPDLDISIEYHVSSQRRFFSASGVLIGCGCAIVLGLFLPLNLELLYLMFSFVSGAILYPIMRDVIPENESGKPLYFFLGILFFTMFIYVIRMIEANNL